MATQGPRAVRSTSEVRNAFVNYARLSVYDRGADFDDWLASVKAEAWAEGLKVGWEATSDRTHYDMPTGYRDLPRYLKRRNPYKEE